MPLSHDSDISHLQKIRPVRLHRQKEKEMSGRTTVFNRCHSFFHQDNSGEKPNYLLGLVCHGSIFYHPSSTVSRIITFSVGTRGQRPEDFTEKADLRVPK